MGLYPGIGQEFNRSFKLSCAKIDNVEYRAYKKCLITVQVCLENNTDLGAEERQKLVELIFANRGDLTQVSPSDLGNTSKGIKATVASFMSNLLSKATGSAYQGSMATTANTRMWNLQDSAFLNTSDLSCYGGPPAVEIFSKSVELASRYLEDVITRDLPKVIRRATDIQRKVCEGQVDRMMAVQRQAQYTDLRSKITHELREASSSVAGESDK